MIVPEVRLPQTTLLDITDWSTIESEDFARPFGSLDKIVLVYKNENYIFKRSWYREKGAYKQEIHYQMWMELIAFYVGKLIEIEVPDTWLARNSNGDAPFKYGVLTRYFYNTETEQAVRGSDILETSVENYDGDKDYNLADILRYASEQKIKNARKIWAQMLLFDCIIGNTDRHHENWQVITDKESSLRRFSPAFDNGISLGWRIPEEELAQRDLDKELRHFKLKIRNSRGGRRFKCTEIVPYIRKHLRTEDKEIARMLRKITCEKLRALIYESRERLNPCFPSEYQLTVQRSGFMVKYIMHRVGELLKSMECGSDQISTH